MITHMYLTGVCIGRGDGRAVLSLTYVCIGRGDGRAVLSLTYVFQGSAQTHP
jgi:hypothetical protein